jgi:hypothetical protein
MSVRFSATPGNLLADLLHALVTKGAGKAELMLGRVMRHQVLRRLPRQLMK